MASILDQYFNFVRRLIPQEVQENAVGLDIGSGECKLVEIKKTGNTFQLLDWAVEPVKNENVAKTIKLIMERLKNPCKALSTAVFGKGTLIRFIDMPRMALQDLKNSFSIEADKYFPFPADQIYTDCYILDPEGKGKQMAVMAAAAKKEIIDARVKFLTDLGFQVHFIGINPIALTNVVNVLGIRKENDQAAVALLDLGESISNLTILVNRLPRFTRDIFVGGRDFSKRISNALNITIEEAEKLKRNPQPRLDEIMSACETIIMNVVQELRLSFDYFCTEKNQEIAELFLTGGGSMLDGITMLFEKNLEIKTTLWDPLGSLSIDPNLSKEELQKNSFKLGVTLGLALYQYD